MEHGNVNLPNGFIINLYKYLDTSVDDHENMEDFYKNKSEDFCKIFEKRELAYGHYDRIQFRPVQQFSDYTEKTSQSYNWLGTSQSTLIFPLSKDIKKRAFGWEGPIEKPSIRIRVGEDRFTRGKGFIAASFCYISDEARNRFMRYDELLDFCQNTIMDLAKAYNEETKLINEPENSIIAEVFGTFSSAEIVILWSAKQYVDILYLVDCIKDIHAVNCDNNEDIVNIFRTTYTTISYPDNLAEYEEETTRNLFEDAKYIRGDALIEIGVQENTDENYIDEAKNHFVDSLRYVSKMFGEVDDPPFEMFICAGEYDLIFKTKSKYVSRIFHKLHAHDENNLGKDMNIHNFEFHKFFLHTSTRLCYTKKDLPACVSGINWDSEKKSICNRTVKFSSQYFDRNWRSNLISNLWAVSRKSFDELQEKIRTCFPAVSSFPVVLDQLFSDYVQCISTAADYIWIMDYSIFIEKVLIILHFYLDEHFMKGRGTKYPLCFSIVPSLDSELPGTAVRSSSFDILQEMTRLVESVEQQTIHISASNKLFFKEQNAHFGYTAQYDLLIHAYYGMIKELMEEIYRHESRPGVQSSLYPLINFRPVHSIESEMFIESPEPNKYDNDRIIVFKLPLDAMNNILHYTPMLIHEVYHYAAPAHRKGRNEYLSLIAVYCLLKASICKLFNNCAEVIVTTIKQKSASAVDYSEIEEQYSSINVYFEDSAQIVIKDVIDENKDAVINDISRYQLKEDSDEILRSWHQKSLYNWFFRPKEVDDGSEDSEKTLCSFEHLIELSLLKVREMLTVETENRDLKGMSSEEFELFDQATKDFIVKSGEDKDIPVQFLQQVLNEADFLYDNELADVFCQLDELLPDCAMVTFSGMTISGYLLQVAINHDANFYEINTLLPTDVLRYGLIIDWILAETEESSVEKTLAEELEKFKKRYLAVYQIQSSVSAGDRDVVMEGAERWCEYFYNCYIKHYMSRFSVIRPWFMELLGKHIMPVLEKPSNQFKDVYSGYIKVLDAEEKDRQDLLFSHNLETIKRFQSQKLIKDVNSRKLVKVPLKSFIIQLPDLAVNEDFSYRISEYTNMYYAFDWILHKLHEYRRIENCTDNTGMWFRGVGNSEFSILPSGLVHFAENCELFHGKCKIDEDTYLSTQRHLYENFRYTADSSPEHNNPSFYTTVDHLALMQHYQTHSNLLDWSEDIDTALYFALECEVNVNEKFCDKQDAKNYDYGDKDGIILILDPVRLNIACEELEEEYGFLNPLEKDDLERFEHIPNLSVLGTEEYYKEFTDLHQSTATSKKWIKSVKNAKKWSFEYLDKPSDEKIIARLPRAVYTSKINPRLKAQSGMFVAFSLLSRPMYPMGKSEVDPKHRIKLFEYESLDELQELYLKGNLASGSVRKNRNPFLYKIIIPKEMKKSLGKRLHWLGFSKERFYPEIQNHHSR